MLDPEEHTRPDFIEIIEKLPPYRQVKEYFRLTPSVEFLSQNPDQSDCQQFDNLSQSYGPEFEDLHSPVQESKFKGHKKVSSVSPSNHKDGKGRTQSAKNTDFGENNGDSMSEEDNYLSRRIGSENRGF